MYLKTDKSLPLVVSQTSDSISHPSSLYRKAWSNPVAVQNDFLSRPSVSSLSMTSNTKVNNMPKHQFSKRKVALKVSSYPQFDSELLDFINKNINFDVKSN